MIRIALCDDEKKILDEVSLCIKKYASEKQLHNIEVTCFDSAMALVSAIEDEKQFDFFLLDVYIGDEIGTELARDIRRRGIESPIVFLTTSVEHAPQCFETGTLRYLLKPLDISKFYEAMDAAIALAEKLGERVITVKTEAGVERVNIGNVIYSEAHAHYQYITFEDGRQIKVRMTVASLYGIFEKYRGFIRVGSAYIVNLRNVKKVSTNEIQMYPNITVPIPRGKHTEIKSAFWSFQSKEGND